MVELIPDLAEICGIHAGDGYMRCRENGKGEVQICGSMQEKDFYDNHVIPLFNKCFNLNIVSKIFSGKTYGFISYDKSIRDFLLDMGFPRGKKSNIVKVPEQIMKSEDSTLACRFLRGIFDTDGNLSFRKAYTGTDKFKHEHNYYPVISITTTSKLLAEDIIHLLNKLNFLFYYYNRDSKKKAEERKYNLVINGNKGLEKWMELIGTRNRVQLTRYLVWQKLGYCPTNTTLEQREEMLKTP